MNIKKRFKELQDKYPQHSSYIVLAEAITGMRVEKRGIAGLLKALVDPADYEKSDRLKLIQHLFSLSSYNISSHTKKRVKMP